MANLLIIHPDRAVRARLVEALGNADAGFDLEIDHVDSLEAAVETDPRPDAIITHLPPGSDGNDEGGAPLPDALLFIPTVVLIDDDEQDSLGRAMSLEPAGVLARDFEPALAVAAVRCALHDAGTVLDPSLVPTALGLLNGGAAAEGDHPTAT